MYLMASLAGIQSQVSSDGGSFIFSSGSQILPYVLKGNSSRGEGLLTQQEQMHLAKKALEFAREKCAGVQTPPR